MIIGATGHLGNLFFVSSSMMGEEALLQNKNAIKAVTEIGAFRDFVLG